MALKTETELMPAFFIGHGSPMNTLESNRFTNAWSELGATLPDDVRSFLVISAHWYLGQSAVTAMARPQTIHDFYGFPQALFDFEYPAPGDPELAHEVAALLSPVPVALDAEQWGIDHGAWSVLAHLAPKANIPVVQLGIDGTQPIEFHIALGERLSSLRRHGVVIVGSGNVVHNLSLANLHRPDEGEEWAVAFDEAVAEIVMTNPAGLGAARTLEGWNLAVPTPDHFLPLAYIAGVAHATGKSLSRFASGPTFRALTMTSYLVAD